MRRIDIHTHILPEHIPDFHKKFGYKGFIQLQHHKPCGAKMMRDDGKFFREIESNCWSAPKRMEECDDLDVSIQVLSTVPVMFSYWAKPDDTLEVAQFLNDHIAGICDEHPTRFLGLATVPMQSPSHAIKELERVMKMGFAGIQIGSHVNDMNLNHPQIKDIFRAAESLGAAIFVHPWDMMGMDRMPDYWLPWLVGMPAETSLAICSMIFGGVFEEFPNLMVTFAHGGGSFPGTIGRIEHGFQVRPDLCAKDNPHSPRKYIDRFWVDSLVHDADALHGILKLFGDSKIVMGSDYPFPLGEHRPGALVAGLPELGVETKEKILWKNALDWLAIESGDPRLKHLLKE